jgi:predicted nucleotide-binding protein
MTTRKKHIDTPPERTKLFGNRDGFKDKLSKRLEVGQELLDRKVEKIPELEQLKNDYSDWNNYNSELLKSSFDKPTNEYKYSYDRCAQKLGMDDYAAGRYQPNDPNYQLKDTKRTIETKHNNLRQLLAKVDLIPTMLGEEEVSNSETNEISTKNIFIIHGHDETRLLELENLLINDFKLTPFVLKKLPNIGSPTIIEKFEFYAQQCSMAIALFTPDDIIEKDGKQYLQARPNVIYELGWFCAKLTRKNVILMLKDGTDIFSDFQGILQIRFKEEIVEKYRDIMMELKAMGLL